MDGLRRQRYVARTGQAMIEFVVGLVAVLAILAGMLQVASLTRIHTETMIEARHEAGRQSMRDLVDGYGMVSDPDYIRDWDAGSDEKRHTGDDETELGSSASFNDLIIDQAVQDAAEWSIIDQSPNDCLSTLHQGGGSVSLFGLVRGHDSQPVPLLPAVQSLLYGAESIDVGTEVWMTWTKGIY